MFRNRRFLPENSGQSGMKDKHEIIHRLSSTPYRLQYPTIRQVMTENGDPGNERQNSLPFAGKNGTIPVKSANMTIRQTKIHERQKKVNLSRSNAGLDEQISIYAV